MGRDGVIGARPDARVLRVLAGQGLVPWTLDGAGMAIVHGAFGASGVVLLDEPRVLPLIDLTGGLAVASVESWLRRPHGGDLSGELVVADGWWFGWPGAVALTAGTMDAGFLGTARRLTGDRAVPLADPAARLSRRHRVEDDLFRSVVGAERHNATVAVALIGVRQMRAIREGAGHVTADMVLDEVLLRLSSAAGADTRVYDYDSDCFAVVGTDAADVTAQAWEERTRRLVDATFGMPFEMDCTSYRLYANGGVAVFPCDYRTVGDLLRGAEVALAQARAGGRSNVLRADPAWLDRARDDLRLATDMLESIADHQFRPFAQPLVNLATGAVDEAEILTRWNHPEAGSIPPSRFIPVAEAHGLITDLTIEMLRSLSRALRAAGGRSALRFAVNISPLDLNWSSMGRIINAITQEDLLPFDRLTVEITESAIMEDPSAARSIVEILRHKGMRVAIDDFGTGYSSFGMLHAMPVDYLKIDRSFVTDIECRPERQKLVQAIQAMAGELGLGTVAEGIENEAAATLLRGFGCTLGQGYHYARPMPVERFLGAEAPAAA